MYKIITVIVSAILLSSCATIQTEEQYYESKAEDLCKNLGEKYDVGYTFDDYVVVLCEDGSMFPVVRDFGS